MAEFIEGQLKVLYEHGHTAEIRHPGENGAFATSFLDQLLGRKGLLVVPDTNVLRDDVARSCRTERTILVSAANAGALRLFCPQHVRDEFEEYSEKWASEHGLSPAEYLQKWKDAYLPLMRMVPREALSDRILTSDELNRVCELRTRDPDDVPAAILSLVLGAFYLTEDSAARSAVYGRQADDSDLLGWLETLRDGSEAGALRTIVSYAYAIPTFGSAIAYHYMQELGVITKWIPIALAVAALIVAIRTPRERYKAIGRGVGTVFSFLAEVQQRQYDALDRFERLAPSEPEWQELARTTDARSAILRACLHTLAREPKGYLSAQELAAKIPDLGIAQSTPYVRESLTQNRIFFKVQRGRWQVGHPYFG